MASLPQPPSLGLVAWAADPLPVLEPWELRTESQ